MFVDVKTPEEKDVVVRAEHVESVTEVEDNRLVLRLVSGQEITVINYDRDRFIRDLRDALRRG